MAGATWESLRPQSNKGQMLSPSNVQPASLSAGRHQAQADGCCYYITHVPFSPQKHDAEYLPCRAKQGVTRVCDSPDLRHLKVDALAHPEFKQVPFPSFKTSVPSM